MPSRQDRQLTADNKTLLLFLNEIFRLTVRRRLHRPRVRIDRKEYGGGVEWSVDRGSPVSHLAGIVLNFQVKMQGFITAYITRVLCMLWFYAFSQQ